MEAHCRKMNLGTLNFCLRIGDAVLKIPDEGGAPREVKQLPITC